MDHDNQVQDQVSSSPLIPMFDPQVYCLEDFCYLFGPKCGRCKKTIYPVEDTALLVRVKARSAEDVT